MAYEVIKYFTDLQDNNYEYNIGDVFPRKGLSVSENRLNELSTDNNRQRVALIKPILAEENYSNMKVSELKEIAKSKGVSDYNTMKKAELISVLEGE